MRVARIVFFILLASIPIQLGKHFWPDFAFVHGIRVDYLSPTLYLTDILVGLIFIFSIHYLWIDFLKLLKNKLFALLITVLLIGSLFALQPIASLYGILKFLEFSYFSFYVANTFTKKDIPPFLYSLSLGGVVSAIILFFQFISQSSIGGPFYFLGERTFNVSTIGVALFNIYGVPILRPNGTFPHPNVASFYLLCVFTYLLYSKNASDKVIELAKRLTIFVLLLGIAITFSRITLLAVVAILLFKFTRKGTLLKAIGVIASCFIVILVFLIPRLLNGLERDIGFRVDLIKTSLSVFSINPILGVGLNNFFHHEILFQHIITATLLQPVHNIYLYWLTTTGIAGGTILSFFFYKLYPNIKRSILGTNAIGLATSSLLLFVATAGFFDHYFLTLQQGQLLVALLLGIAFSRLAKEQVLV